MGISDSGFAFGLDMTPRIRELWRFPVKSMGGERLDSASITAGGIEGDRVVRAKSSNRLRLTARTRPELLGLRGSTALDGTPLIDGLPWDSEEALARVRLVAGHDVELLADRSQARFDVLPISLVTDGAIEALGVDHRRLRANIVVEGIDGLAERGWHGVAIRVGEAVIGVRQVRGRCVMTTFDPDTLEQDTSVLQRIVDDFEGRFALDCYVVSPGIARVGDDVELVGHWTLERNDPSLQIGFARPYWIPVL